VVFYGVVQRTDKNIEMRAIAMMLPEQVLAAPLTQAQLREGRKESEVFKEEDSGKKWHVNKVYTDFIADTEKPAWHWSPGQLLK
jgi:hypothetical protein